MRNAIKLRSGNSCNPQLAKQTNKHYLGDLRREGPQCIKPDSGTHILGASHHHLKGLYIERHGEAIMEAAQGGCLTVLVADDGGMAASQDILHNTEYHSNVLSNKPESSLLRMRPDILIFHIPKR